MAGHNGPGKPLVTVIMPNYNKEGFIAESVRGIQNQSYENLELIIVDDASTDGSQDTIRRLAAGDGRIKIFPLGKNSGAAYARNTGLRNSRGDYVAFCDSDDIWFPEKLAIQVEALERNPDVAVVHGDSLIIDAAGNANGRTFSSVYCTKGQSRDGFIFNDLIRTNYICTSTVLLKRTCAESVGLFPENIKWLEDWIFMLRLANRYKFLYIGEPLVRYRVYDGNSLYDTENYEKSRLSAYPMILSEFPSMDNSTKAFLHQRMGRVLLGFNRPAESRAHLIKSLSKRPLNPKVLGYFVMSFFWSKHNRVS